MKSYYPGTKMFKNLTFDVQRLDFYDYQIVITAERCVNQDAYEYHLKVVPTENVICREQGIQPSMKPILEKQLPPVSGITHWKNLDRMKEHGGNV